MKFTAITNTDIGTRKKTNQDSMLVMQAQTDSGPVLLAAVCDGMGGLSKGEVASAAMIKALSDWFQGQLPSLLAGGFQPLLLQQQWDSLADRVNQKLQLYTRQNGGEMGTTAVVFLIVGNYYYIMNIGDSRAYLISDNIYQLTKDQTFVQQEIDAGRMTPQEAFQDPRRSVLLQCIGASDGVVPDYYSGQLAAHQVFMLGCDGMFHVVQPQEFLHAFQYNALKNKNNMKKISREMIDRIISRGELDNISIILIRVD